MTINSIKELVRTVPDFPKPGILFRDITPVLMVPQARTFLIRAILEQFRVERVDAVAAVEARGFLFGVPLADALGVPFIPVRKAGKLPWKSVSETYALEYGTATIEVHRDAVSTGQRILIHDDLLATGGTCAAAGRLIERLGGQVAGFSFLIELESLAGAAGLSTAFGAPVHRVISY